MNCKNCGAPMTLIRERDYYVCEYCGSTYFPNISTEGIRLLGENPDGIKCPLCGILLEMATFDDAYQGYVCSRCRSLLFTRTDFRRIIETRRARATTPPEMPARYTPEELRRQIRCPVCAGAMETYPYMGPGNIVIDTCHTCDLIWLDHRELEKVINAPGRDRGVPLPKEEDAKQERNPSVKRHEQFEGNLLDLLARLLD
ncbi:MAG: zf-TFIIB domain-containing protein [Anaerolineae bacterium]|jgi:Zn-finger nucleic acid-binding protein|nr:zf-TFIIB domain-containing protein [Anaerolineae bacterium]